MEGFLEDYGLVLLFLIIALQAAGGAGLPGKTALVVAAILAADGRWSISAVIAVAAVAVIVGGYAGYAIGRLGARRLLERPFLAARLKRPLETAERFFDDHGPKAVFLARFVPGLKVIAALAAGVCRMRWAVFAFWHALAAIAFALVFGLTAFWAGRGAIELVEQFGLLVLIPVAALSVLAWIGFQAIRRRRRLRTT